ncbi:MAG: DUF4854 domain-containing protein [Mogibacterium sp.]|jgi:hypothetical protein|nr:DUF4854 domain-containing protein [Mogibacterium sp.]MBQ6500913.1 DUF4854 domain-containing protein [Mogibacterium sp.]
MKKRILLVLLAMLVGMTMIMASCGGGGSTPEEPMTLEKYVKDDAEVQNAIDSAMNDSNVLVEIKENAIIYTFDLSTMEGYTEELAHSEEIQAALQSALDSAGGTFGGIAKSIEDASGITGITTVVNYTWGDEVVVSKTFTSADAPADSSGN